MDHSPIFRDRVVFDPDAFVKVSKVQASPSWENSASTMSNGMISDCEGSFEEKTNRLRVDDFSD